MLPLTVAVCGVTALAPPVVTAGGLAATAVAPQANPVSRPASTVMKRLTFPPLGRLKPETLTSDRSFGDGLATPQRRNKRPPALLLTDQRRCVLGSVRRTGLVIGIVVALAGLALAAAEAHARVQVPHITSVRCWPPKGCRQAHVVAPGGTLRFTGRNLRSGMLARFPHRRTTAARAA